MRVLKIILIAATVLVLAVIGARTLFGVQIGEFAFKAAVKSTLGQNALADAPDGLTVVLVGTGSPLPDPGRVGPMTVVVAGDRVFIVDAGAGSGRRFGELRLPWTNVEAVFLTHFHSDHIDGLGEVMLQHWAAGGAQAPLPIHGPDGVGQVVAGFEKRQAADLAAVGEPGKPALALLLASKALDRLAGDDRRNQWGRKQRSARLLE